MLTKLLLTLLVVNLALAKSSQKTWDGQARIKRSGYGYYNSNPFDYYIPSYYYNPNYDSYYNPYNNYYPDFYTDNQTPDPQDIKEVSLQVSGTGITDDGCNLDRVKEQCKSQYAPGDYCRAVAGVKDCTKKLQCFSVFKSQLDQLDQPCNRQ